MEYTPSLFLQSINLTNRQTCGIIRNVVSMEVTINKNPLANVRDVPLEGVDNLSP